MTALLVFLPDLRRSAGVRGWGWVRVSTEEAVDFRRTRGAARVGGGASCLHAHPFEDLTPTSTIHAATVACFEYKRLALYNGKHVDQYWITMAAYLLPTLGDLTMAEVRHKHVSNLLGARP